ncbi:uncharacterized protein LOC115713676 [Cannabis sativa]|uniref:uncharacterized protein LOC115713676 n=1 Tax=Cannabis sativa TaxID=3483 RepID=UPI0029CA4376|nr:uncharacterized protein LOC115713676 [Cannabis sativa]
METKLSAGRGMHLKHKLRFDSVLEVPRQGLGGGILLFWKYSIDVNVITYSLNHVDCIINNFNGKDWHFSGYYGSPYANQKFATWTLLNRLFDTAPLLPWALKIMFQDPKFSNLRSNRFHFENHWLKDPSFTNLLNSSWVNPQDLSSSPLQVFLDKQSHCLSEIRTWSKSQHPIRLQISRTQADLNNLLNDSQLTPNSLSQVATLQSQLDGLLLKEEVYWKQRSRVDWLRAGDRNTKKFHHRASTRKKNNLICQITLPDGSTSHDPATITSQYLHFYNSLFTSQGLCDMAVNSLLQGITNRLSTHQVAFLAEPYTEAEVKQALFSPSGDKALGPDGLNSLFYKSNCINQSAFLQGRQITDNILLANEIIHAINSRRSGKVGWAAIKLDMEKAFDRVKWSFLNRLLAHVGFPPSFSSLIMRCLSTVQFWLSINGSLTDTFHSTRGIRQGDPLSPYLFLLIAEGLSAAIRLQETNAHFSGIQICRGAQPLSHLLFADDSMVFSQVHSRASDSLNVILNLYNKATSQLVNRDKSSILFSHNTSADAQLQFCQSLQLHGEGFISKYLGVPHCVGRVSNSMFHYLLQKVSSRLNSWNEKFFSRAGKETLIKAVVQAIPSFAMSCFKVPKLICLKIQSLIAKFWWGSQGTKKIHWENWDVISVSKFFGGLGFRILSSHNQALLAKQAWRRSILWGRQLLQKGLVWKIGTGVNVPLSAPNWIPNIQRPILLHPLDQSQAFVSSFINHDSTSKVHKLQYFFPSYQVENILKIPIDPTSTDSLIWGFHSSGIITVKSAYHLACSLAYLDVPSSSNPNPYLHWWKTLWSLPVPPKIKHFIWRAFHHILPCAFNLFLKRSLPHPNCSICGHNTESVTHALIGCSRAKSIWKSSRFKQFYLAYHRSDIKDFLIQALHNISKQDFPIFITFVWQIWNSRNSILFNKSGVTNNVEEIVVNYLQDYSAAQCKHQDDNLHSEATHTPPASQHQHPPSLSPETPSLFVDAAIDQQNGITRTGFIFKHGFQDVLASHYHQLPGAVSPIFAEGQALLQSLKWCIDSQFSPQIVFSDCLNLVSKVNGAWKDNSALSGLVSRIRLLFSNFPGASLQFLPRQFNMDAHVLAREALRSREVR